MLQHVMMGNGARDVKRTALPHVPAVTRSQPSVTNVLMVSMKNFVIIHAKVAVNPTDVTKPQDYVTHANLVSMVIIVWNHVDTVRNQSVTNIQEYALLVKMVTMVTNAVWPVDTVQRVSVSKIQALVCMDVQQESLDIGAMRHVTTAWVGDVTR